MKISLIVCLLSILAFLPLNTYANVVNVDKKTRILSKKSRNLNPRVIKLALKAYNKAWEQGQIDKDIITIIDFSKPSSQNRLFVIDLDKDDIQIETNVAHGRNSGVVNSRKFSNQPGSYKSSIGVYKTGNTYQGKHGLSLRLYGLEKKFNGKAYSRAIVMHSAWYATKGFLKRYGYIGRSLGCPAVSPKLIKPIINRIKEGTMMFVYYPNQQWLAESEYLQ